MIHEARYSIPKKHQNQKVRVLFMRNQFAADLEFGMGKEPMERFIDFSLIMLAQHILAVSCLQPPCQRLRRHFWQNLLGLPSHPKEPIVATSSAFGGPR